MKGEHTDVVDLSILMPAMMFRGKNQIGPGRRTLLGMHRQIEKKKRASVERAKRGRWTN